MSYEIEVTSRASMHNVSTLRTVFFEDPWHRNSSDETPSALQPNALTEVTAVLVLVMGVLGNCVLIVAFLCKPWGRRAQVLDRIVAALAIVGLLTSLVTTPLHLYAVTAGIQAFLLGAWFKVYIFDLLLSIERVTIGCHMLNVSQLFCSVIDITKHNLIE